MELNQCFSPTSSDDLSLCFCEILMVCYHYRQADVSTVDFIKPREAKDRHDSTIPLDSHTEILVAIGSLR